MSWEPVKLAIQLGQERNLTPTQRLLLIHLAQHWNATKGYGWPSVETLADEVGCCERTVQNDLEVLQEEYLVMIHRRRGGRQRPAFYELLFMNSETVQPATRKGASGSVKGASGSVKGASGSVKGAADAPDPLKETPTEPPTETPTPPRDHERDGVQRGDGHRPNKELEKTVPVISGQETQNGRRLSDGNSRKPALAGVQGKV